MDEQERDQYFMRLALAEASRAPVLGEIPVAAVLVRDDTVLATAHNYREVRQDPTAHAEMIVLQQAAQQLRSWRLTDTTLYVTLEPCPMCAGALVQARVRRLVFGAWDPKAGACGSIFDIPAEPRLNHRVLVTGGVLKLDCQALLRQFFRGLRLEAAEKSVVPGE
ncbi:MAG: tRNA adenosine(34) deaminase TadA [Nitrospiraceae bacterium]|nr:tRNA adenosine(34) deaminase TadA [Nitrospiraceae bacterium]